jgi:hypothetical protein
MKAAIESNAEAGRFQRYMYHLSSPQPEQRLSAENIRAVGLGGPRGTRLQHSPSQRVLPNAGTIRSIGVSQPESVRCQWIAVLQYRLLAADLLQRQFAFVVELFTGRSFAARRVKFIPVCDLVHTSLRLHLLSCTRAKAEGRHVRGAAFIGRRFTGWAMDFIRPHACAVDGYGCPQPIIDQTALERCQFGEITLKKG